MAYRVGAKVKWAWYGSFIHGRVEEVFHETVTKTIKGKKITRRGSQETPAYLVKSEAGNLALKLQSELEKDTKQKTSSIRMFQNS